MQNEPQNSIYSTTPIPQFIVFLESTLEKVNSLCLRHPNNHDLPNSFSEYTEIIDVYSARGMDPASKDK